MPGNSRHLALAVPDLTAHAVGIAYGYVEEVALAGGLPMGHGPVDHVAEIVELVAELLDL